MNEANIIKALHKTCEEIENNFVKIIKTGYEMGFGKIANVGSCGLFAVVIDNKVYVANLGDSKGVFIGNLIS